MSANFRKQSGRIIVGRHRLILDHNTQNTSSVTKTQAATLSKWEIMSQLCLPSINWERHLELVLSEKSNVRSSCFWNPKWTLINELLSSFYSVAHHIVTGLKVAVKILNKGKIKHLEMAEKVRREINILKMCTHPHIIRLWVLICTASFVQVQCCSSLCDTLWCSFSSVFVIFKDYFISIFARMFVDMKWLIHLPIFSWLWSLFLVVNCLITLCQEVDCLLTKRGISFIRLCLVLSTVIITELSTEIWSQR